MKGEQGRKWRDDKGWEMYEGQSVSLARMESCGNQIWEGRVGSSWWNPSILAWDV